MSQRGPQLAAAMQHAIASVVLLALLAQVSFFFFGLMDPIHRIETLWGKALEARRAVVWKQGSVFKGLADRLPATARIYMMYPQPLVHWNVVYYCYPRFVTVTMTNAAYRNAEEYKDWNERPTEDWLITNDFTHVLSFKNGGLIWEVGPGIGRVLSEPEETHATQ
jgi:hypothetical protein